MKLRFEWDPSKAAANRRKHGVSFHEAATSFEDEHGVYLPDARALERFVLIAYSNHQRLLVTVHAIKDEDRIRIISARKTTNKERRRYEEGEEG
jgi:uncharacterized DUF497 family protein